MRLWGSAGHMTLYELNSMVTATLKEVFQELLWVEAELTEIRESNGHCYMEVVQKDADSSALIARASAKCWHTQWLRVAKKFSKATGTLPQRGMKLLMAVRVEFHQAYGFSLIVNDIDPTYTLGDMLQKRDKIIAALKASGLYDKQRELCLPLFCQRIAVISAATAAGYGDFCDQLINNEYGLRFETELFPAIMQGEQAPASIIAALNAIVQRGLPFAPGQPAASLFSQLEEPFDCIVIIRGGGATADMTCFDDQTLAEAIANCPLPVITGIGHERDECILDLIANTRQKTPTAVAAFLIESLASVLARVEQAQQHIIYNIRACVERNITKVERLQTAIRTAATLYCTKQLHRLELLAQHINSLDPKLPLKRGYSLTYANGKIVTSTTSLSAGQELTTLLADGEVKSVVTTAEASPLATEAN